MRTYRFYKNELGWFIDLKWFPFNKAWLAMVAGADTLLDKIAEGSNEVILKIDTSPMPYSDGVLERTVKISLSEGAFYEAKTGYTEIERYKVESVWLCPATLWVFLRYPKKIYYKVVTQTQ